MARSDIKLNHLSELLQLFSTEYKSKTLLRYIDQQTGKWTEWRGEELARQSLLAAQALVRVGVKPGDRVAIYSPNMVEGIVIELGLMAIRAISVPLYSTCSPDQAAYIADHAQVRLMIVGGQFQYNNAYQLLGHHSTLRQLVVLDRSVTLDPSDQSTLRYDTFKIGRAHV